MSEELELEQYVDWQSLEYYDRRIKDYIDVRCTEDLRIGGEVSAQWLNIVPVNDNLNNLYIVTDDFVTGATFFESGVSCGKGTVVYLSTSPSGLCYKILARVVPPDGSISEGVSELNLTIDKLTERIVLLENQLSNNSVVNDDLEDKIKTHELESSYKFDATNLAIQTVTKDLQDVEEDISDLKKDIDHVSEDLQTINHDIHDILHDHSTKLNDAGKIFATKESLEALETRIDNIPQVSLDGYATEQYVQDKIEEIRLPDLSNYATVADVDKKVAELVDGAPSALNTLAELAEALKEQEDVLDTLATKSSLATVATTGSYKDLKDVPEIPSVEGLASEKFVEQAINSIPAVDLTGYAKQEDIPDVSEFLRQEDLPKVPTKVSELENDAGYLSQHQSLKGLATETYVQEQIAAIPDPDLSDYAKKDDLPDTSKFLTTVPSEYVTEKELEDKGYLTEHQSLNGLATEEYVQQQIDKIPQPDLEEYAKKTDLPDTSNFITTIPDEYVTEEELSAKGYLTEHQSLAGLATEEFVREQIELIPEIDTSDLASKADLELKADKSYVDEQLENVTVDLTGYATEDFVRTEIANAQLGNDGETVIDLSYLATKTDLANETAKLSRRIDELSSIQYGTF